MNYYEELGIKPDADVDQIRKAHRRLVKLMHPDQQRDPSLKQLAETQMRRLNSIVSTLLDPEQREEYDEDLREQLSARPVVQKAWRTVPWWIGSTAGAVVLTVGAVWIWADHLGSSFSRAPISVSPQVATADPAKTVAPPPSHWPDPTPVRPAVSEVPAKKPENADARTDLNKIEPNKSFQLPDAKALAKQFPAKESPVKASLDKDKHPLERIMPERQLPLDRQPAVSDKEVISNKRPVEHQAPVPVADPKKFRLPSGLQPTLAASTGRSVPLPPAPKLPANPSSHEESTSVVFPALPSAFDPKVDVPKPVSPVTSTAGSAGRSAATSVDTLEGEWVYAPKEPEKRKAGFYPPEFIKLKLAENEGSLHGQYDARYEVSGNTKPISPEVSFQVKATDKTAHKFIWQSSNGSRGTLAIRAIDGGTIRLEWRTTVFSGGPALTSGIATLVRRSPGTSIR